MTHAGIIQAFGGIRPLAMAIGIDWKIAVHWERRGIPSKYWHRVVKAWGERIPRQLTIEDLERWKPHAPQRRAA
jgi:hypothetical protein